VLRRERRAISLGCPAAFVVRAWGVNVGVAARNQTARLVGAGELMVAGSM
jgi:hypothetical protein